MKILTLNCRIQSVEFELFEMPQEQELCHGIIDKIGLESASITYKTATKKSPQDGLKPVFEHRNAIEIILQLLADEKYGIDAVGHRVVHGGEKYFQSVVIDNEVKKEIYKNFELAPLHNPYNFKGIETIERLLPAIPQVAVFDTSFHQTIPEVAYRYSLPERIYQQYRIRKYGFHGISHRFAAERIATLLKKPLHKLNIISLHLGQGASLCAIKSGISIDTTMGFTPLEGLMMTTRSGSINPDIVIFLQKCGLSLNDVETCLNRESGVLGISGISDNIKDVVKSMQEGNRKAKLAIDMFVYHIREYLGAYYLLLGGEVHALGFTGGIGENSDIIRQSVCSKLDVFGIKLDHKKNKKTINGIEANINQSGTRVKIFVIPGNEKIFIARDVYRIIREKPSR